MNKLAKPLVTSDNIITFAGLIDLVEIWPNTGQIPGVPKNPRYILEKGVNDLTNSIRDDPEFLQLNPLIVYPYAGIYVALAGNQRRAICVDLGFKSVPCMVLNEKLSVEKLKKFIVIDNLGYGKHDYDILANEFDFEELQYWGLELPDLEIEDPGEPDGDDSIDNQDLKITVTFKGNFDKFDLIKDRILTITKEFQGIEIKG